MAGKLPPSLVASIAARRCVFFGGAGLTASSGGATWDQLVEEMKKKFGYVSPLTDPFQIVRDIGRKVGDEIVYRWVQERLAKAEIVGPRAQLLGLPWRAVFTTNYDAALERGLAKSTKLLVRTIATGLEFVFPPAESELLCVKLMGSADIPFRQPGSMVLDAGDLQIAREERGRIFDLLAGAAANMTFMFAGYSFRDSLFINILDRISKSLGSVPNTYFAVFKDEPDPSSKYLLEINNVQAIVGDPDQVIADLSKEVSTRDLADLTKKRLLVGADIVALDSRKIAQFLNLYDPVFLDRVDGHLSPIDFFHGTSSSLKGFASKWHYPREETKSILKAVASTPPHKGHLVIVEGIPGSGRTFSILAAIDQLVRESQMLALSVPANAIQPVPSVEEFKSFLGEVKQQCDAARVASPKGIVFWSETMLDSFRLTRFHQLAESLNLPMTLIIEGLPGAHKDFAQFFATAVEVAEKIDQAEKDRLSKYLTETITKLRLPELTAEESASIIEEEEMFLAIVYRSLDPARRSIQNIVRDCYNELGNDEKVLAILASLGSSVQVDLPVTVARKTLSELQGKFYTYPDVYEIISKAQAILRIVQDKRQNDEVRTHHSLIGKHLVDRNESHHLDHLAVAVAKSVDLRSQVEAEFIRSFFITKGVNSRGMYCPVSEDAIEASLLELKSRQPARPILHHLARLYSNRDENDARIVPLLKEALAEPPELYGLVERKGNVLTTLARTLWRQREKNLVTRSRTDPGLQEIFDLLNEARRSSPTPHPYDVYARILKELISHKNGAEKLELINEGLELIEEGLDRNLEDIDERISLPELKIDFVNMLNPAEALRLAEEMRNNGEGAGYLVLAQVELYKNRNPLQASVYLDRALGAPKYPSRALLAKLGVILEDTSPHYKTAEDLADRLAATKKYDENWKCQYFSGIAYVANGRQGDAARCFRVSGRRASITRPREVELFWMEHGKRKTFTGKIDRRMSEFDGGIYAHNVRGWGTEIYFNPAVQKHRALLRPGLIVDFELGFSPRGPVAFDVRPSQ